MLKRALLISLLVGPLSIAQAHDPGLSRAIVELHETGLAIHMVYARQDIEVPVPMDKDFDGRVTATEFSAVRSRLHSIMSAGVELRTAGQLVTPNSVQAQLAPSDSIKVELYYDYPEASAFDLRIPLLAQLARGHRQYLTVKDANSQLRSQHILAANSPPLLVQAPGPAAYAVFRDFLIEGVWHIWFGFDHILFLITLLLPAVLVYRDARWTAQQELRPAITDILKVVTAFTVAHSITLALAVLGVVTPPSSPVEALIAFSVLVTAVNNLRPFFPASRWLLAFGFGLVHGFGFAGVLQELDLPGNALVLSLLGFNLGVEAGQLAIVLLVFPVAAALRHGQLYRTWIFSGGSAAAALVATTWMFERVFDYEVLGL